MNSYLDLGGTWYREVKAVPSSCPIGYSFPGPVGPYCVIDKAPMLIDDVVEASSTNSNARIAVTTTDTKNAVNVSNRKRLICAAGYKLTEAGYKPGKVCRKQTSAYPGSPAVAAHCKSKFNN